MKIFVNVGLWLRESFIKADTQRLLESLGAVSYCEKDPLYGEELQKAAAGADVLFTGWGQKTIHAADIPSVKIIAHTGGTVGGIIDCDVFEKGIKVLSGNAYYAESVAEGVIAYMLFALRNMGYYSYELSQGRWCENRTEGLLDQRVGIISVGAISRIVLEHLKAYRARVKVFSTRPDPAYAEKMGFTYASLDEIFSTCRVVSLHTARNPETRHMIKAEHFAKLEDGAVFLNTARGEVIDEKALADELKTGRIRAVLDVYQTEPLPADSPFVGLENAILFPHQCGPTYDRRDFVTRGLIDDVVSFFAGREVKNEISLDVARRMTH
ncbi:MAG: hydroxyacid dehydrogenase [Clostridia bacterium]|nr:hydroxyacid dehydrogenase [Clostridia bacterium]